ncbi:MAG: DUF4097 family beta strand repeat protein [Clostridia bacterium]|nr:DUF4097 family beta strand repeat protein [Clostridia bacterium]
MKGFVIALVAILIISLMVCGGLIIVYGNDFLKGNLNLQIDDWKDLAFDFGNYDTYEVNDTKTSDGVNINKLTASSVVADIEVIKWDKNEFSATFIGEISTRGEKPYLKMTENGSTLSFEIKYPDNAKNISNFSSSLKLYVYVPENYSNNISLNSVSGNINVTSFEVSQISLNSVSGKILLDNITGNDLVASTVSGMLDFNEVYFTSSTLSTTSGKIKLSGDPGKLNANTVSGDVILSLYELNGDIKIDTISGSADLYLDKNISADVSLSSISGNYSTGMPISLNSSKKGHVSFIVGDHPTASVEMTSVSGGISVNEN